MRDIIVTILIFGLIPFILVRPFVGVLAWTWISMMNPHRLCWGFAYDMPFAQIIAIVTIFSFLYYREKSIPQSSSLLWLWIVFVGWTAVTTYFALYPEDAFQAWTQFMKISFMAFLTVIMTSDKKKLYALIWVVALSLGFYGLKGGIFTLATGGGFRVWGPADSFIADNNALALALVMALPLIRFLQLNASSKLMNRSLIMLMAFTVLGILGTQSRGGFVGLGVMGIYLIMKGRHKLAFSALAIIAIPLFLTFMPQDWHERMDTIINYRQDQSAMMRINAWKFAINFTRDYPITGGGFDSFTQETFNVYSPNPELFTGAHSIYFETLGEHGYVGLILFMLIGFVAFRQTGKIIKQTKEHEDLAWARDLAAMIQVSIVGYAVAGAFLELATFDLYYVLISMVVVLNTILARHFKRASSEKEEGIEVEGVQIVGIGRRPA